jgi:hypothetical protein
MGPQEAQGLQGPTGALGAPVSAQQAGPPTTVAALSEHAKLTAEDLRLVDVVDYAKKLERLCVAPRARWAAPTGLLLLGGWLGGWFAGRPAGDRWMLVSLAFGIGALAVGYYVPKQRTESIEAICTDLREYLNRWAAVTGENPMSPEYEALIVARLNRGNDSVWTRLWQFVTR